MGETSRPQHLGKFHLPVSADVQKPENIFEQGVILLSAPE